MTSNMNGYIHIPFCRSKCGYCAFYSITDVNERLLKAYPTLLGREWRLRVEGEMRFETLYIGGGTPSLLGPEGVHALFAALPDCELGAEVTMEVNPADVTLALATTMRECGVTRVSIGAQSFDLAVLAKLGRRHTADQITEAVTCLRTAGFKNISLDLIACIPGVSHIQFQETLKRAVALTPEHLSVYPLSIEPGTRFERAVQVGQLVPIGDDAGLDIVAETESILFQAGYARYEISNYARPGFECRHNLAVWRGEDYVGVGPSAASREGLKRHTNVSDIDGWRVALEAGRLPPAEEVTLTLDEDELERFVMRLRLAEGLSVDPITELGRKRLVTFSRLGRVGLVRQLLNGAYTLTARGREVADAVMAEFQP